MYARYLGILPWHDPVFHVEAISGCHRVYRYHEERSCFSVVGKFVSLDEPDPAVWGALAQYLGYLGVFIAAAVLRRLRERYAVGLVSDAQWVFTEPELAITGLRDLFEVRVFSSRCGYKKPDPGLFAKARAARGCTASSFGPRGTARANVRTPPSASTRNSSRRLRPCCQTAENGPSVASRLAPGPF